MLGPWYEARADEEEEEEEGFVATVIRFALTFAVLSFVF
jgi:hypothetical protein